MRGCPCFSPHSDQLWEHHFKSQNKVVSFLITFKDIICLGLILLNDLVYLGVLGLICLDMEGEADHGDELGFLNLVVDIAEEEFEGLECLALGALADRIGREQLTKSGKDLFMDLLDDWHRFCASVGLILDQSPVVSEILLFVEGCWL